jgi:hypothetical protein
MLVSARDALHSVEKAIGDVRSNESRLADVLASLSQDADRLRKQMVDAYRALAAIRLDALKRNEAVGELDNAERRALDLLQGHKTKLEALLRRHGEAQRAVETAESDHRAKTAAVEAAREPIAVLQARVEKDLAADPTWTAQRQRVEAATKIAEAADAKADQSEGDRDAKRKPYEADRLFMYLWTRGFNTAKYSAGNFVRYIDRWVARIVGYDGARPNYALLNEIPLRLRAHADQRVRELEAEDAKLEAIERKALEAAGILPLESTLAKAVELLEAAEKSRGDAQAKLAGLDQERETLIEQGDKSVHEQALSLLADAVSREDLQTMLREAQATRSPEDDRIVREVETAQTDLGKAEAQIARVRDETREIARRRAELEGVRDNVRRHRYDGPGGQFEIDRQDSLGDTIGGIVRGAIQGAVLWSILQRGYRQRQWDSGGGGGWDSGGSRGGSGSWGGGSKPPFRLPSSTRMGGGIRTGRSGGGGFKTGGRF